VLAVEIILRGTGIRADAAGDKFVRALRPGEPAAQNGTEACRAIIGCQGAAHF
jgi:hypothetical protein